MTTEMIVAVSAMAVAVIGALAGAVVTVMKAFAEMRIQMSRIEGTTSDIHADVKAQSAPGGINGPIQVPDQITVSVKEVK